MGLTWEEPNNKNFTALYTEGKVNPNKIKDLVNLDSSQSENEAEIDNQNIEKLSK